MVFPVSQKSSLYYTDDNLRTCLIVVAYGALLAEVNIVITIDGILMIVCVSRVRAFIGNELELVLQVTKFLHVSYPGLSTFWKKEKLCRYTIQFSDQV